MPPVLHKFSSNIEKYVKFPFIFCFFIELTISTVVFAHWWIGAFRLVMITDNDIAVMASARNIWGGGGGWTFMVFFHAMACIGLQCRLWHEAFLEAEKRTRTVTPIIYKSGYAGSWRTSRCFASYWMRNGFIFWFCWTSWNSKRKHWKRLDEKLKMKT